MALCINQSGTYRNITTLCINQSGTYRNITAGCINQAGTYRCFGFVFGPALGSSYEGGFLICKQAPNLRWVVSPRSTEVSRTWHSRNDANTTAQSVSGCTGWFIPTFDQANNPGGVCMSFWGPSPCRSLAEYWTSTSQCAYAYVTGFNGNDNKRGMTKGYTYCVRAFRCVTY